LKSPTARRYNQLFLSSQESQEKTVGKSIIVLKQSKNSLGGMAPRALIDLVGKNAKDNRLKLGRTMIISSDEDSDGNVET